MNEVTSHAASTSSPTAPPCRPGRAARGRRLQHPRRAPRDPEPLPHQRGPLCEGGVSGALDYGPHTDWKLAWIWDGEVVTCPWHSLEFHVPTGQCLALPDVRLRKFDVRSVDGEVRVVL
jgi:nitrite reductase/ring-hydroxylating ferredoxin subunit